MVRLDVLAPAVLDAIWSLHQQDVAQIIRLIRWCALLFPPPSKIRTYLTAFVLGLQNMEEHRPPPILSSCLAAAPNSRSNG